MTLVTAAELHAVMIYAHAHVETFVGPLNDSMGEFDITTPERIAAFLAQVAHESGELRYVEEIASGAAYDGRADLGNTRPDAIRIAAEHGSTPGPFWKGHGLIQVTGYMNHLACGVALSIDLMNNPRALCEPENAARSAGWFWKSRGLNTLADQGQFAAITRRINGGVNGAALRVAYWQKFTAVLS